MSKTCLLSFNRHINANGPFNIINVLCFLGNKNEKTVNNEDEMIPLSGKNFFC